MGWGGWYGYIMKSMFAGERALVSLSDLMPLIDFFMFGDLNESRNFIWTTLLGTRDNVINAIYFVLILSAG